MSIGDVKVCPCGQKIVFVKEDVEGGEPKVHPLDCSSPVYRVSVSPDGKLRAFKASREVPEDPFADAAYLVSHFRTCRKVDEFRKERKALEGQ
ncbi:MAG: hypothetical protein ACYSUN_15640 [Planctomycetota bacterium]|jgi:hypothetical protein